MNVTIQELFHIMARDYDNSERYMTHAIQSNSTEGGRGSFYKVLNHNANISVHNAIWYANQLGFEFKVINKKTKQEYTIQRDPAVILKRKRTPLVTPETEKVLLKINTLQRILAHIYIQCTWKDEATGITFLWKPYNAIKHRQWALFIEDNNILYKAGNLKKEMLLKIEPLLDSFIKYCFEIVKHRENDEKSTKS